MPDCQEGCNPIGNVASWEEKSLGTPSLDCLILSSPGSPSVNLKTDLKQTIWFILALGT